MQANVNKALTAVRNAQAEHAVYLAEIAKIRKGLPRSAEKGRVVLLPMVAKFYGVSVVAGAGKATGSMVLNAESSGYEAARKALQRMLADIYQSSGKTEVDLVAQALRIIGKMTAAQRRKLLASI
jgi:hypothetical protein